MSDNSLDAPIAPDAGDVDQFVLVVQFLQVSLQLRGFPRHDSLIPCNTLGVALIGSAPRRAGRVPCARAFLVTTARHAAIDLFRQILDDGRRTDRQQSG